MAESSAFLKNTQTKFAGFSAVWQGKPDCFCFNKLNPCTESKIMV